MIGLIGGALLWAQPALAVSDFAAYDADGSGAVDLREFRDGISRTTAGALIDVDAAAAASADAGEILAVFTTYDANADEGLDEMEFNAFAAALHGAPSGAVAARAADRL